MDAKQKPVLFFLVLALFFIIAGADVLRPGLLRLAIAYCILGGIAFWGRAEPVGVLRPIPLRPLQVAVSAIAMAVLFLLMLVRKASLP